MIQYFPNAYPAQSFYTGQQCRELDQQVSQVLGVSTMELMRRAGQALFEAIVQRYPQASRLVICCGTGNNAGDGYVLAQLAQGAGWHVHLYQVDGRQLQGDAGVAQAEFAAGSASRIKAVDESNLANVCATLTEPGSHSTGTVLVDALLGTGSSGPPRRTTAALIRSLNASPEPVVAVDIPSGLDAALTGGWEAADVVAADLTCSFLGPKLCLHTGGGVDFAGDLQYHALGATAAAFAELSGIPALTFDPIDLPQRALSTYKHRQGKVVLVGGDHGMGGAIALAARAALAVGAGLVQVITRSDHVAPILAQAPELMVTDAGNWPLCERLLAEADVVAVGPGLGRAAWGRNLYGLVAQVAEQTPTVFDADALFLLAEELRSLPATSKSLATPALQRVITPHTGEAARLLNLTSAQVQRDRVSAAEQLAAVTQAVTILKGPGSLLAAPNATNSVLGLCTQGNPAMASAGMGDVLTGVIAGLLAQQAGPHKDVAGVAATAMCWHSAAADSAAADKKAADKKKADKSAAATKNSAADKSAAATKNSAADAMSSTLIASDVINALPTLLAN